ncbi:FAD dependent oxidoreductase [Beutenbergia cavernae DSM 12333]|uniref:FAD dependent oxidoreductase n=1 Tax=Beutenbergia cavernae (strain ATCC BAA-8 / DSM 12333 / CCUG 43141 / JCM 11478 / NBRC 16432 / NCIMB 13614 / HKI 0122) TaxID=471853 RepID=C5C263_BEUC1|nr:FAD-dependent oxidoreductase [Beutenbergia cavernae]ACQ81688.1 FAD dependent oxidoreductase [Beutenbergia cavernae DSM 12333]
MSRQNNLRADVLIVGGGVGGVAAALAALRRGRSVVMTEEYAWLGGQLTTQAVPPDEHTWIEQFGCTRTYRAFREGVRDYYRTWYPLTEAARRAPDLNPGLGKVSRLCHEPRVALAVLEGMLAPYRSAGLLRVLTGHVAVAADVDGDRVRAVTVADAAGERVTIEAPFVLDATELGDLLPLTDAEHVTGFESQAETGEPSAPAEAQPWNQQAFSWVFAVEHDEGADHTIDRPDSYGFWREYQPEVWPDRLLSLTAPDPRTLETLTRTFVPHSDSGPVLADQSKDPGDRDLWLFRRILARDQFTPGFARSDVTVVNWPMIDYLPGPLVGVSDEEREKHLDGARQLSFSMLYWLQTEAPRPDGGTGWPGLRLRPDLMGSEDGLAIAPYIRESRRIRARTTVVEQDLSMAVRGDAGAVAYRDSVGVGMYRIDLHPSTGGDNYLDVPSSPFQIPLGALLPVRLGNLLAAGKNIGTTHITNGCYRLHPVEWNIGEAAGALAAHCLDQGLTPEQVRADDNRLEAFQHELVGDGFELAWPEIKGY